VPRKHTGSLTHASGSAVVRVGDTAAVCGVRAEVLLASDVGSFVGIGDDDSEVRALGLLVPNVELSTGCSPAHLPGQPPSPLAQTLATRLQNLLYTANLISADELRITYAPPTIDDEDDPSEPRKEETKAWWVLYIDVLFISLDGNPFDAAWSSILAALTDTKLPRAYWDPDRTCILCDDAIANAKTLRMEKLPVASTFAVYSTQQKERGKGKEDGGGLRKWILADPDTFEEGLCRESLTVVVDCSGAESGAPARIVMLEKQGGVAVGMAEIKQVVKVAAERWSIWNGVLKETGSSTFRS
jgi:exosome complex component RRP43